MSIRFLARPRISTPFLLVCGMLQSAPRADAQCELARLVASDGALGDWLGSRASLSGDYGFVATSQHDALGSNSGAVYVAQRTAAGWSFTDKLLASDGTAGTRFGSSVSVDGDRALVGASHGAYVFELTPSGWVEVQKLLAADVVPGDFFGGAVALLGDRALVGAFGQDTSAGADVGAAYIFERGPGGWVEVHKLLHPEPHALDGFGAGDLGEDLVVIGVGGRDLHGFQNKGAVYVFERDATGWDEGTRLSIYEGIEYDRFGSTIAVQGDRFLAGAPGEDSIVGGRGAAYVFRREASGWVREARLIPDGPTAYGFAEHDVDLSGDRAVVGAYLTGDPGEQAGRVCVYKRTDQGWAFEYRFGGSVQPQYIPTSFGTAVSVDGDHILVGARNNGDVCSQSGCDSGAAYVFSASLASSSNFCDSVPNSTGAAAVISVAGCAEVARNDVRLFARPVPDGQSGIFFYGDRALAPLPFGDGFRCVGGRVYRLPLTHAVDEELAWDLDLTSPPQVGGQIQTGSTWRFQAYYRDTAAGASGFNVSDALEILFPN